MFRAKVVFFFVLLPLVAWGQAAQRSAALRTNTVNAIKTEKKNIDEREEGWNRENLKASWSVSLGAGRRDDAMANRRTESSFAAGLDASYDLTSFLNLTVNPRAIFQNGHIQSDSAKAGKSNVLELSEASATLHAKESAALSLGALNQTRDHSGLLVGDLAFPAARVTLMAGSSQESNAALFGQTAIPTSSSLTTNSRDFEKTPSFNSAGVKGRLKTGGLTGTVRALHFEFHDLPSGVANDSGILGNTTVEGISAQSSAFASRFYGTEGAASLRYDFNRSFGLLVEAVGIRNEGAPSGKNQGSAARAQLDLWIGPIKWSPSYTYFRIEPDAAVAYYNSSMFETNRVGYAGGLSLQYKKLFSFTVSGGEREVLFESASQSRDRFFTLSLETLNAPL